MEQQLQAFFCIFSNFVQSAQRQPRPDPLVCAVCTIKGGGGVCAWGRQSARGLYTLQKHRGEYFVKNLTIGRPLVLLCPQKFPNDFLKSEHDAPTPTPTPPKPYKISTNYLKLFLTNLQKEKFFSIILIVNQGGELL